MDTSPAASHPRTALITGATDGIGRATAHHLAAQGWRVGVLGRSTKRTDRVVAEITDGGGTAFGVVANLSSMTEARRAVDEVVGKVDHLDVLLLNANHITQQRQVTDENIEANLAIGWLSRVVMMRGLESLLAASDGQILSVVGMNLDRLDTDDVTLPGSPGGMKSLGQWQWAVQTYLRGWNTHSTVPANTYMPGLVKTKILADEPGRLQRLAVSVAMRLIATTPEASARHIATALDTLGSSAARDRYYSVSKDKGVRDLGSSTADIERIWALSNRTTDRWLA